MTVTAGNQATKTEKAPIGFWKAWSLTVGIMIGSGVFMLPAVLAPFGSVSFLGWLLSATGAILFALILGRLASRTDRTGGPYAYAHDAFGDLAGFLVAWGYWIGVVFATTAIAVAFAGYFGSVVPFMGEDGFRQALVAAAVIWLLTGVNIRSVGAAAEVQLISTILKLIPLAVVILLGVFAGSPENIPAFNPKELPVGGALAATALLTMWAFLGIEGAVIPAGEIRNAKKTIPRAVVAATLTVAAFYILATGAVMLLVPDNILVNSNAPFVDAAARLGKAGAWLIAIGALVSTAGALNGNIMMSGQVPMAAAIDGVAPKFLANRNKGHAPQLALIISSVLSSLLLILNYRAGLVAAFTFLITISTLGTVMSYTMSAAADLKFSLKRAKMWVLIAIVAIIFSLVALAGSGIKDTLWGVVLLLAGLPVYYWGKRQRAAAASSLDGPENRA